MDFISCFSGCSLGDYGLVQAGHKPVGFIENDPFCQRISSLRFPGAKPYHDIKEVSESELEPVDLIFGTPPCQPVSVAGKQKGAKDERWLWGELFRLLRGVRPRFVLLENPTGLFTGGFGYVLRELAALGYDAQWQVLSAAQFGAPHLRERVFILAYAGGLHGQPGIIPPMFGGWAEKAQQTRLGGGGSGGYWPTPTASDGVRSGPHVGGNDSLPYAVKAGLWPTPRASSAHGAGEHGKGGQDLQTAAGGLLSGDWVECLMGVPRGWTNPECDAPQPFPGWPMGRGEYQYEWEPPRTIASRVDPYRPKRLKALGNGCVPHCTRYFGEILREVEG